MKIEEILAKDRITETNPFAFTRLEAKINAVRKQYLPKKFSLVVRAAFCAVVLVIGANAYVVFFYGNAQKQMAEQSSSYQKFMSDNYYDVLASSYTTNLFFERNK